MKTLTTKTELKHRIALAPHGSFCPPRLRVIRFGVVSLVIAVIGIALLLCTLARASASPETAVQLLCTGNVDHQKELTVVLLTHRGDRYFAMYPKGSGIETAMNLLYRGERLTVVGHMSDSGFGAWVIHRPTARFHYGQAKDQSDYLSFPLNADHYFGECIVVNGAIADF
jgi:hypothetical protein